MGVVVFVGVGVGVTAHGPYPPSDWASPQLPHGPDRVSVPMFQAYDVEKDVGFTTSYAPNNTSGPDPFSNP